MFVPNWNRFCTGRSSPLYFCQVSDRTWRFGDWGASGEGDASAEPAPKRRKQKHRGKADGGRGGAGPAPVEVVTCDACGEVLSEHRKGLSCTECFDYDLCVACYADGGNGHSKATGHKFRSLFLHHGAG